MDHLFNGKVPTELNLFDWAVEVAERGAGEILFTSMDNDGTKVLLMKLAKLSSIVNIQSSFREGRQCMQHL
jgi:cyclase